MKVVVLGATGNVGAEVVKQAAAAGNDVVAYVRRPEAVVTHDHVRVVKGELDDVAGLAAAATGADAVIVAVTGSVKDGTFMQRYLPSIVDGVVRAGVSRLVLVSVFGAGDTAGKASGLMRLVYGTVLKKFLADKVESEKILPGSGLDYTIVHPVNLKGAPALPDAVVKPVDEISKVPGMPTLPFANVAAALLELASKADGSGQRLVITTPKAWKPA